MVLYKKILLSSLTFLGAQPLAAWDIPTWSEIDKSLYVKPVLAGITMLSSCWALKEWRQRVAQKKELEGRLTSQSQYAHDEIEKLKNAIKRAQDDEEYILELGSYIEKLHLRYRAEEEYLTLEIRPFIYWSNLLQNFEGSLDAYEARLHQDSVETRNHIQQMEENLKRWEQRKCLFEEGKHQFKQLEIIYQLLTQWTYVIEKQKDFIRIQVLMTPAYKEKYAFEMQALERDLSVEMLNDYIVSLYKEEKFSFVKYAQSLQEEISKLKAILTFTQDPQREILLPVQEALIEEAQEILKALEVVYDFVIATSYYREQKLAQELEQMTQKVNYLEKRAAQQECFSSMKEAGTLFTFMNQLDTNHFSLFPHTQGNKVKSDHPLSGAVVSGIFHWFNSSPTGLQKTHHIVSPASAYIPDALTHISAVSNEPRSDYTPALTHSPINKTALVPSSQTAPPSTWNSTISKFANMIGSLVTY